VITFDVVMAMEPRYEGEARLAILAVMACNLHPKSRNADLPAVPGCLPWTSCGQLARIFLTVAS
jgi:hypothetical protein